jgi:hypothetical protein
LDGMQPTITQVPPTVERSIITTRSCGHLDERSTAALAPRLTSNRGRGRQRSSVSANYHRCTTTCASGEAMQTRVCEIRTGD